MIVDIVVGHLESCGIIFFGNQIILASCKLLHKLQPIRVSAKVGIVIIVVIVIAIVVGHWRAPGRHFSMAAR